MKYEWEAEVALALQDIAECLPEGIDLLGVAVMQSENGEGAIVSTNYVFGHVIDELDVTGDILGDAQAAYNDAHEKSDNFYQAKNRTIQ